MGISRTFLFDVCVRNGLLGVCHIQRCIAIHGTAVDLYPDIVQDNEFIERDKWLLNGRRKS